MKVRIEKMQHNHSDTIIKSKGFCKACDSIRDFWDDGWREQKENAI